MRRVLTRRGTTAAILGLLLLMLAAASPRARATAVPPDAMYELGHVALPGGTGGFGHAVDGFTLDPQGRRAYVALNAGGDEPSLQVVDIRSSQPRVIGAVDGHTIGSMATSADGTRLYAVYDADRIAVFDVTGSIPELVRTEELSMLRPKLAVSPDGTTLYVGDSGGVSHAISAYRLPGMDKLPFRPEVSVDISRMVVSPDGSQLAVTGSFDGHLVTVDTATGAVHQVGDDDPDDRIAAFAFSGDSRSVLVESSTDQAMTVRRIDSRTGEVQQSRALPEDMPGDLAVTPDDQYVYVTGEDGILRVLDASSLRTARRVHLPETRSVAKVRVVQDLRSLDYGRLVTVQDGDALDDSAHPVLTVFEQRGLGEPASGPLAGAAGGPPEAAAGPGATHGTPQDSPVRLVLAGVVGVGVLAVIAGIGVLYTRGRL